MSKETWSMETMRMINKLTPDIKGKAFDPDWFLLRQRLESVDALRQAASDFVSNETRLATGISLITKNPMKYLATIQGGIGPDVWDEEKEIEAVDFRDASNQAIAHAEELSGQVTMLSESFVQ